MVIRCSKGNEAELFPEIFYENSNLDDSSPVYLLELIWKCIICSIFSIFKNVRLMELLLYTLSIWIYSKASDLCQQVELASGFESDMQDRGKECLVNFNVKKTQIALFDHLMSPSIVKSDSLWLRVKLNN